MALKKALGTIDVFSLASGAMISSGLFILPAIVYSKAGPAIILSYIIAAFIIIPSLVSKAELATAMPKAGGTYFFVDKSLGPLFGTIAGFTSWISLILKASFALIGIGIFLGSYVSLPYVTLKTVAVFFAVFFGIINTVSVKHTSNLQIILVFVMIFMLGIYIFFGMGKINVHNFVPFIPQGKMSIISVSGIIFISFGGLTSIASVAEEVKNPGKTIPRGMFSAFFVVTLLYVLIVFVTVGILKPDKFLTTLTPISTGAEVLFGKPGFILLELAALMAFLTTGNGGILSASRSPMAMARDGLFPHFFSLVNKRTKTPLVSIISTVIVMILFIVFLDLEHLVKVASAMMLLLFMLENVSLILMRESRIASYHPAYKSPFYPWMQITGIVFYILVLTQMGSYVLILTGIFIILSALWFLFYSGIKNKKDSALIHIVKRIAAKEIQTDTLSDELKTILMERDNIIEDRFDKIISEARIFDLNGLYSRADLFKLLAQEISVYFTEPAEKILHLLEKRETESTTVIHPGLAIPHIIIGEKDQFEIIVVRSKKGIVFTKEMPPVHTIFALAGSRKERNFHLQALMAIAQIVQSSFFKNHWMKALHEKDLKNIILLAERSRKGDST